MKPKRDDLVSMAAHDLRNPLTCIQAYSQILLAAEDGQTERAKIIGRIAWCSRFMEQIVHDLLDHAAIEQGSLSVAKLELSLPELLREAVDAIAPAAACRGVSVRFIAGEESARILGDRARLLQLVQNLVTNAIRHSPEGKGRVDVRLRDSGGEFVIEVADNGEGLSLERQERLFGPWSLTDGHQERGSLGLGLFIARRIVELHGGRLWVLSEGKGKGATFFFSLRNVAHGVAAGGPSDAALEVAPRVVPESGRIAPSRAVLPRPFAGWALEMAFAAAVLAGCMAFSKPFSWRAPSGPVLQASVGGLP